MASRDAFARADTSRRILRPPGAPPMRAQKVMVPDLAGVERRPRQPT